METFQGSRSALSRLLGKINLAIPKTAEATSNLIQRLMLASLDPAMAKSAIGILGPFLSGFSFLFILRIVMTCNCREVSICISLCSHGTTSHYNQKVDPTTWRSGCYSCGMVSYI